MFKWFILGLLLGASSTHSIAVNFTWDDYEKGTGLHVFYQGITSENTPWTVREVRNTDIPFYQTLFTDPGVVSTMGHGKGESPEKMEEYVKAWSDRFATGVPRGKLTIEHPNNPNPIGGIQLAQCQRPGVGEIVRALIPSAQGKGLGKALLGFIVEEWGLALRKIALGLDPEAPPCARDKFKCFKGEALKAIYTTARPSNPASWQCYKYFAFEPSEPTDTTDTAPLISCEQWEESQNGPLENYIITRHC